MNKKIALIVTVLLAVSISITYAGNRSRIGTAGAQELRIPIGSRGTAMGGAVISSITGVESIQWNPAGLAFTEGTEVMFTHLPYFVDINVNFVGIATNIEDFGTLAASAKIVSIGDIEVTDDYYQDGTGAFFNPTLMVLTASYARILTTRVSFGATAKLINEKIHDVSATGFAVDVGFIYEPGWRDMALGIAIKNYGPEMRFSGIGFSRPLDGRQGAAEGAAFEIPSTFDIGLSYSVYNQGPNLGKLCGNFTSCNYSQDVWSGGAEYSYDDTYFLRAGYSYADQNDYLYGVTFGGGLKFKMGNTNMFFEYAWNQTEVFEDNHFFTIRTTF